MGVRFSYVAPTDIDEAVDFLTRWGDEATVIAGGQSLVPLLSLRLAKPRYVVDIGRISSLKGIREEADSVVIGAFTTHREIAESPIIQKYCPMMAEAAAQIGNVRVRNRGTIGGSLAHADPAAELPAVLTALDAEIRVYGRNGERSVTPGEFFISYLTTSLEPAEIVTAVRVPKCDGHGQAFVEFTRRAGDFAVVGVGADVRLDAEGVCRQARLALCGVGPTPVRASRAEALLRDKPLNDSVINEAAKAVAAGVEPESDVFASAAYRRVLAEVLTARALQAAVQRADRGER